MTILPILTKLVSFIALLIPFVVSQEEIGDGLSRSFLQRTVKAAAASLLSKSEQNLQPWDELSAEGIEEARKIFSDNAIFVQYSEVGSEKGRDDAIFIEDGGQCFVAFQSTTSTIDDIGQNANLNTKMLCKDFTNECCEFRQGFVNGWTFSNGPHRTQWKAALEKDVEECVSRCDTDSPEPCLVITGHSQGGGIATVASLQLSSKTSDYEVITFAAPPVLTLSPNQCSPQMDFNRHFRFGKAIFKDGIGGGSAGLLFDMVSFIGPDPIPGFESFSVGNFIIISSEDDNNVAFIGFNTDKVLNPWDQWPFPLGDAHALYKYAGSDHETTGYLSIVKRMSETAAFPMQVKGFADGMHCGRGEHGVDLCISDRCDRANGEARPTCKPKLNDGERCNNYNDCKSGRCDAKNDNPFNMVCHSTSPNGTPCNEDSDCLSGRCPSRVPSKCVPLAELNEPCAMDKDCVSGLVCKGTFNRKCKNNSRDNEL